MTTVATEAWTLAQLEWTLECVAELSFGTRPGRESVPRAHRERRRRAPFPFVAAEHLVDLERGLSQLRETDPESFSILRAAYLDPGQDGLSRSVRVTLWAVEHGRSVRGGWRALRRAKRKLLAALNGGESVADERQSHQGSTMRRKTGPDAQRRLGRP